MSDAEVVNCPRCGNPTQDTLKIDPGMKIALASSGYSGLPESVCGSCYEELSGQVSKGVQLLAEKKAREQNKVMLWKNRVSLVKQGRAHMVQKRFSDAAVSYEKYLRVLEIVYDLKAGEISPDIFNRSTRSKELTVIASVYWDLLRIYDTSSAYGDRMAKAATKLAQFLPYSSIYPDIVKKAAVFQRSCKHPAVMKRFLKTTKSKARCFIATAAFESEYAAEVTTLRLFRDQKLRKSTWGRRFIAVYYRKSPRWAERLNRHASLKPLVRLPLSALARLIRFSQKQ